MVSYPPEPRLEAPKKQLLKSERNLLQGHALCGEWKCSRAAFFESADGKSQRGALVGSRGSA